LKVISRAAKRQNFGDKQNDDSAAALGCFSILSSDRTVLASFSFLSAADRQQIERGQFFIFFMQLTVK